MGNTRFIVEQAIISISRRSRTSISMILGLTLAFMMIGGVSSTVETYYNDTVEGFDHYSGGLVLVQQGVPFFNGLPINSVIENEVISQINTLETVGEFVEMSWAPEKNSDTVVGDILFGVGNGSYSNIPYYTALGLDILQGDYPQEGKNQVTIGKTTDAYQHYAQIGGNWNIRDVDFTISGVLDTDLVLPSRYLVTSLSVFRSITATKNYVNMILIFPKEGITLSELEFDLEANLSFMNALNKNERDQVLGSLLDNLRDFTSYVTVLTGVSSILFTGIFSKLSIDLRRREFGIKKALGTKPRSLYLEYLTELGIIGVTSAILGMMLGIFTSSVVLFRVHENFSTFSNFWEKELHIINSIPWTFPLSVLFGLVFVVGGYMIFMLNKKPIIELLG